MSFKLDDPDSLFANLVLLSNDLDGMEMLTAGLKSGFQHHLVEPDRLNEQVGDLAWALMCATEKPVRVHLVGWGRPGRITLSGNTLDAETAGEFSIFFGSNPPEELVLYGSRVADGVAGDKFCRDLANLCGGRVIASKQRVGRETDGHNYWFEGLQRDISLCFTEELLESYPYSF
ncbi:MAG: DUF4347 domain-containing protein [Alphaproteobacteria bacterium]|nr:DUF4347 domain-containing protein [Alphaproteobacteria bacterium]